MASSRSVPMLPSLNALLAFETAARHLSFTRAATELGVTQTAVSHQIKSLEAELGTALFRRTPQRVALTLEGQAWAAELAIIFNRLRSVNHKLRQPVQSLRPHVSVSVIPSLASRWLVPRLGRFMEQHPEVDVRISANERLVDFALEPVDVGVRYGLGRYAGLVSTKLADDGLVVVATPAQLARQRFARPEDLHGQILLHDDFPDAWGRWFSARRKKCPLNTPMNQFTDSAMLIEAVLRGQGIGLARWSLAVDELAQGRLALVFPTIAPFPTGLAYYLVAPRENLRRKAVRGFRDWIVNEAVGLQPPPS
jgi:LysR family transcriptional regulator, glycine cleavage system transcriptional activator